MIGRVMVFDKHVEGSDKALYSRYSVSSDHVRNKWERIYEGLLNIMNTGIEKLF